MLLHSCKVESEQHSPKWKSTQNDVLPYSRKYWWFLNLAVWPQTECNKNLNLEVGSCSVLCHHLSFPPLGSYLSVFNLLSWRRWHFPPRSRWWSLSVSVSASPSCVRFSLSRVSSRLFVGDFVFWGSYRRVRIHLVCCWSAVTLRRWNKGTSLQGSFYKQDNYM